MHACIFGLGGRTLLALRGAYRQPRLIPGPNACKTDDTYINRTNGGELHLMNNQERKAARIARDKARKAEKKAALLEEYGCFEKVVSNQTMHKSLLKRRDGVEWKGSVQKYLQYAIVKIYRTKHSLLTGEMSVNKTVRKMTVVERGKVRQVQGVLIDTRVVQGALCDHCITPVTQPTLIYDNPASTKGKGIDHARRRMSCHIERMVRKVGPEFYALTYDFSGFFDSISHRVCDDILEKEGIDERLRKLIMYCMKMYQEQDFMEIKDPEERERKLIALANNELCGATLGSQESQDFALAVPNDLDHLVKDKCGVKGYIRYMDDGIILHESKEFLKDLLVLIREIAKKLGLVLNEKKTRITKSTRGFMFLKIRYVVTKTGRIIKRIARSGIIRMRRKLKKFHGLVRRGLMTLDDVFRSFFSWYGNAKKNAKTYRSRKRLLQFYNSLFNRYKTGGIVA